jgi:hypothetical protein
MSPDDTVSDLLLEWEERTAAGFPARPEELCRARPELLAELRRCIDLLGFVSPLLDLGATTSSRAAVPAVPGFEILGRLGGGGMGVVYRARDTTLKRVVAIKMPHLGVLRGDAARSRFEREARVLAQLRHPNIVPIHSAGLADGHPYFVMDYVPQGSLAAQASRITGQVAAVTGIVEKVARAVHHAHERGVLHRDLKPSNILLDERGEPLVADFGLAKTAGADAGAETMPLTGCADTPHATPPDACLTVAQLTRPGVRPGTPLYMAPEQLRDGPGQVTARADVWALGVILFELLTGRHPFGHRSDAERSAGTCQEVPPRPRSLCREVDPWLESVVLKCLAEDPTRRYATAAALADDLTSWRRGEPPSTVPGGRVRGLLRRVRRRPALMVVVAVLFMACATLAVVYQRRPPSPAETEERAEQEYRTATAPLVRDLARGRPVSLVTATTRDLAHRWRGGAGRVSFDSNPPDAGFVTVSADGPRFLELLPETGTAAYRLTVELRHKARVRSSDGAEIAVAFAGAQYQTEGGPQWFFGRVKFSDLGPRATIFKDRAGQPSSVLQLGFFHLGSSRSESYRTVAYGGQSVFYPPAGTEPGPWRRLEIEVNPGQCRARHWDGAAMTLTPEGEWPQALFQFRLRYPELRQIEPGLVLGGALGLYLEGSVLSLRRFDVEPLEERK